MIKYNCVVYIAIVLWCCFIVEGDVIVPTKYGRVRGFVTDRSQVFYGIPYAAPPIGDLRWKPPMLPTSWAPQIYNATEKMPACPQYHCAALNPSYICPNETSESCLFLNIWVPLGATAQSKLPVMVFIHGGNFMQLSAISPLFDGEDFAKMSGVILVSLDYRMGALGFLYTGSGPDGIRGNYGIMDQRQALIWVNQNIRNFGGDPLNVTLFGQSAGAQSTLIHVMSNKSAPYFQKAIVESSPISIPYKRTVDALVLAETIAELLHCQLRDTKCLRSKTAEEIVIAQTLARSKFTSLKLLEFFQPLGPRVDGDEVLMEPIDALRQGKFRDIPIMLGTVTEETRIYVYEVWKKPVKSSTAAAILLATYPAHYLQIIDQYPMVNKTDARDDLVQIMTDFIFTCTARYAMDNFAKFNKNPVFRYEFNHAFSFDGGWENFTCCDHHVCHGSELPYVFHTAQRAGYILTNDEETLSKSMIIYWSNFATTSDPNKGPHEEDKLWPRYNPGQTQEVMYFMTPENKIVENFRKTYCDFWDTIGYSA